SLIPEPQTGDTNPLTVAEIAAVTGPLRHLAEDAMGCDQVIRTVSGLLCRMFNALPADCEVRGEALDGLRARVLRPDSFAAAPAAEALVTWALGSCRELLRVERTPHLRACLENQHDIYNTETTLDVWKALKPAS
ncbi:MAG: hypothetical protein VW405_04215, partial [Rhodospirillaceae bacterium]